METATPAGWYDDGSGRQRWWDGSSWTEHYAPAPPTAPVVAATPSGSLQRIPLEQKRQIVAMQIGRAVSKGARVEMQTDDSAVVVFGHRPNHILHLILTLVTFGFWAFIWIIVALASRERRQTLRVDDYGQPLWSNPA